MFISVLLGFSAHFAESLHRCSVAVPHMSMFFVLVAISCQIARARCIPLIQQHRQSVPCGFQSKPTSTGTNIHLEPFFSQIWVKIAVAGCDAAVVMPGKLALHPTKYP